MKNFFLPTSSKRFARQGFTLIELLVVIAIIAILAAILFPVFARARENARRASCQSNLKQIALGVFQYTQDYDERVPDGNNINYFGRGWAGPLNPYMKSTQIFKCASDSTGGPLSNSYGYNRNFGAGDFPSRPRAISEFTATARTVMFFEVLSTGVWDQTSQNEDESAVGNGLINNLEPGNPRYATGLMRGIASATNKYDGGSSSEFGRHLEGANYAFADGHVKWLKGRNVSPGANNATSGDCGTAANAANTDCGTVGATFSIN